MAGIGFAVRRPDPHALAIHQFIGVTQVGPHHETRFALQVEDRTQNLAGLAFGVEVVGEDQAAAQIDLEDMPVGRDELPPLQIEQRGTARAGVVGVVLARQDESSRILQAKAGKLARFDQNLATAVDQALGRRAVVSPR